MPVLQSRPGRLAPLAAAGLLAAVLSGCVQPPAYPLVNHQRLVALAAPDVWRRLHAFLQDEGIAVIAEDPVAGTIDARQAEVGRGVLSAYADCGRTPDLLHPTQSRTMALTIVVRPAAEGARVTANALFSQTLRTRRAGALTVACGSKGVLESAVLAVASGQPMEAAVVPQ